MLSLCAPKYCRIFSNTLYTHTHTNIFILIIIESRGNIKAYIENYENTIFYCVNLCKFFMHVTDYDIAVARKVLAQLYLSPMFVRMHKIGVIVLDYPVLRWTWHIYLCVSFLVECPRESAAKPTCHNDCALGSTRTKHAKFAFGMCTIS